MSLLLSTFALGVALEASSAPASMSASSEPSSSASSAPALADEPSSQPFISSQRALVRSEGPVETRMRIAVANEWGVHPGGPLGFSLGVSLGHERWSGVLEAWVLFPTIASSTVESGSINVFSVGGTGGACYEHPLFTGALSGCLLFRAAALLVEAHHLSDLATGWKFVASPGLRIAAEWPRDSALALYVAAHAFVAVVRGEVRAPSISWAQSWVFGGAQAGFRVRIQ